MAASYIGFIVLAFVLVSSLALGAATAWFVVWKTHKPTLWMLTPLFAFCWLMLVGGPLVSLGLYLPARARTVTPAPVLIAPTPDQEVPVPLDAPLSPEAGSSDTE